MHWRLKELAIHILEVGAKHPDLQKELQGTFDLAQEGIEDGESPEHEVELAYSFIQSLIDKKE